jgi:hypothetical protein
MYLRVDLKRMKRPLPEKHTGKSSLRQDGKETALCSQDPAWIERQTGDIAVPGWAWINEPDSSQVCVVDHPRAYAINILDCSDGLDEPYHDPYCAGIGGEGGDNPCDYPVAGEASTWGRSRAFSDKNWRVVRPESRC